jgi:hypothetical protein
MNKTTSPLILAIAIACHQANKVWCEMNGDFSQKNWDEAEEWQRESAIKGVTFRQENPEASHDAQHNAWMEDKIADGWVFGEEKNTDLKTHPCLVAFEKLPEFQQKKDALFCSIVDSMLAAEIKSNVFTKGFEKDSLGARRVRVEFNPGNNGVVQNTKEAFARIINRVEKLKDKKVSPLDQGELIRCIALSQTASEEAAMWAVKAATFEEA